MFSSVQSLSCVQLYDPMDCSMPGFPVHHQLPEFTQTHVHWVSDAIQPSHPLLSPSPSAFRVFSNESVLCIRWPKYCSFSFSISPSHEYSGLISFRMDWLHLLAVQGTLKSLLQPQFKSINSLALSLLYNPTLTSIHDYWIKCWKYIIRYLFKPTPRVNRNLSYELWVITMCPHGFTLGKKCTFQVCAVDKGEPMHVWEQKVFGKSL